MNFELPKLPYKKNALEPYMSEETLNYHYGKHHKKYVDTLNELIKDSPFKNMSLEEIILNSEGKIFNNAAQHFNHSFFWECLSPNKGGNPSGKIKKIIEKFFGNFENFKKEFSEKASSNFGSGWTWLVLDQDGHASICNTSNADTPIKNEIIPLLVIDVWEHAYYIDYRNERPKYIDSFWDLINWDFVNSHIK